jgi:sulfite exporter TauE/SafE
MLDLLLMASLGLLGSFGHCLGMCGPITVAFSLSQGSTAQDQGSQVRFHLLLNLGRIISYALVGAMVGGIGSVLVAGGQMAGVGSGLRRAIALATGLLLIWFGLGQINPGQLPPVPLLNPMAQASWHNRLGRAMTALQRQPQGWAPLLLGLVWGLMPCGFLYAAQLKAAETTNLWRGGAAMLAFGLGTLPTMVGLGATTTALSADQRGQLFRLAGWITLLVGLLTLVRSSNGVDFTGHGALITLALALIARPLSHRWPALLTYRRTLGVGAFVLSVAHVAHMVTLGWDPRALPFLLPQLQVGGWAGAIALGLMIPLAATSSNQAQAKLGQYWRQLHRLVVPIFDLVVVHTLLLGSSYLGGFDRSPRHGLAAIGLGSLALIVLGLRWRPRTPVQPLL